MKKMIWRSALLAMSVAFLMPLRSFADGKDSPVHEEMEAMGKSMRLLNRQYADASQKDSSLELVATIIKHAQTARSLVPPQVAKQTGDAQTALLDTFHKDLDELLADLGVLKDAIAAGNADAAKAEMEKIGKLKGSSHKELGVGNHKHGDQPPAGQAVPPPPPGQ